MRTREAARYPRAMSAHRTRPSAAPFCLLLGPLLAAQEERHLPLAASAEAAFARAGEEHKRVLVYQDWPT